MVIPLTHLSMHTDLLHLRCPACNPRYLEECLVKPFQMVAIHSCLYCHSCFILAAHADLHGHVFIKQHTVHWLAPSMAPSVRSHARNKFGLCQLTMALSERGLVRRMPGID